MGVILSGDLNARVGGGVNYAVNITNTGGSDAGDLPLVSATAKALTGDVTALAVAGGCSELSLGASCGFNAPYTVQASDPDQLQNTATAVFLPRGSIVPVEGSGSFTTNVIRPSVVLDLGPDQTITPGAPTTTVTVTNSGSSPLTDVSVAGAGCDRAIGALAAGESSIYLCTLTFTTLTTTAAATVTGTPVVGAQASASDSILITVINPTLSVTNSIASVTRTVTITVPNSGDVDLTGVLVTNPGLPSCDRTIASLAAGESFVYTCTESGLGNGVIDTAPVSATSVLGGVSAIAGPFASLPDPMIRSGSAVTFDITVRNNSSVDLTGVSINSVQVPDCVRSLGAMAAGAVVTYSCVASNVTEDLTNVVSAIGTPPVGSPVFSNSAASVDVIQPVLGLTVRDDQTIVSGSTASFVVEVRNVGDTTLRGVVVTDAAAPDCARTIGTLAPGEVSSYSCTVADVTAGFSTATTVTGTPSVGAAVTAVASATVSVINPAIGIALSPADQTVLIGGGAAFTVTVTNTGDAQLTGVTASSPLAPDCDRAFGNLSPGSSVTYTCSIAGLTGDFLNTVTATGTPPVGSPVSAIASGSVDIIAPSIIIERSILVVAS